MDKCWNKLLNLLLNINIFFVNLSHRLFKDKLKNIIPIAIILTISLDTQDVEIILTGTQNYPLADDLLIITVPGHTEGHTVLLYDNNFLFTGDHLAWSDNYHQLIAFRGACWYSWTELTKSMAKLTNYSFEWVLPGHGRRYHADTQKMQQELAKCLQWMQKK